MAPTSLRLASLTMALSRVLVLSMGFRSKKGGMTGRLAKLHLPRLTSNSSGAWISSKWPTAEVTIHSSLSKCSSCFSNLPAVGVMARTMSCATEGFSAMTRVFINTFFNLLNFYGFGEKWARRIKKSQCNLGPNHPRNRAIKLVQSVEPGRVADAHHYNIELLAHVCTRPHALTCMN